MTTTLTTKIYLIALTLILLFASNVLAQDKFETRADYSSAQSATGGPSSAPSSITVTRNLTSMSLAFTANQGQWDEQVSFRANAGGATMWFGSDGAYYQFTRTIEPEEYSIRQQS